MRLLLDTHVLIWWLTGDRKLSRAVADIISSDENDIAVSAAAAMVLAYSGIAGFDPLPA